jgi:hypothetical protein
MPATTPDRPEAGQAQAPTNKLREPLLVLAAAAGAWAIGVFGIATNRPFGIYLLLVGLSFFVAAHREQDVVDWWQKSRWLVRGVAFAVAILLIVLGWYLGTNFIEPPTTVVDTEAREQIGDLRSKIAALSAQLQTTVDFVASEKAEREAAQKRQDDERRAKRALYERLSKLADDGRTKRVALFDVKVTDAVATFDAWVKSTPATLRSMSLADCAAAFENPVPGPRVGYPGLPEDRNLRAFMAIALIASVEQCRSNHAQQ